MESARIIESRSSVENVWEKITQSSYFLSKEKKATFKKHWDSVVLIGSMRDKSFGHLRKEGRTREDPKRSSCSLSRKQHYKL